MNSPILVFGANGFLGSHLMAVCANLGLDVFGVDLAGTSKWGEFTRESFGCPRLPCYEISADTNSLAALKKLIEQHRPSALLHVAGTTNRSSDGSAWVHCTKANVLSTAAIIAAIVDTPEKRRPIVVMAGSQMEYGTAPMPWSEEQRPTPVSAYGASKLAATEILLAAIRARVIQGISVRLPLLYGPAQAPNMLVPEAICNGLTGVPFAMSSGLQKRRMLYAKDAAHFLIALIEKLYHSDPRIPPILNSPASEPVSMLDLAKKIMALLNRPDALHVGALPPRLADQLDLWPNTAVADGLCLCKLTPLDEGLVSTVDWYRTNRWFVERFGSGTATNSAPRATRS